MHDPCQLERTLRKCFRNAVLYAAHLCADSNREEIKPKANHIVYVQGENRNGINQMISVYFAFNLPFFRPLCHRTQIELSFTHAKFVEFI